MMEKGGVPFCHDFVSCSKIRSPTCMLPAYVSHFNVRHAYHMYRCKRVYRNIPTNPSPLPAGETLQLLSNSSYGCAFCTQNCVVVVDTGCAAL